MNLLETVWFLISFLIITIILLVDPKSPLTGASTNRVLGLFSSPSAGQEFVYRLGALLISSFFIVTPILSLDR